MSDETPLFIGEYEDIPVDNKGRLIVPAAIRRVLPTHVTSLVIARWFDGCLAGFDPIGWQQVLQQIRDGSHKGRVKRQIARWVMGGSRGDENRPAGASAGTPVSCSIHLKSRIVRRSAAWATG